MESELYHLEVQLAKTALVLQICKTKSEQTFPPAPFTPSPDAIGGAHLTLACWCGNVRQRGPGLAG